MARLIRQIRVRANIIWKTYFMQQKEIVDYRNIPIKGHSHLFHELTRTI